VGHLPVVDPVHVATLLSRRPGCAFELLIRRFGMN